MDKKEIVVFSGAGMSAESGIDTFRDSGGLWEKHRIEDVATPEAWVRQPQVVLNFYNARLAQLKKVKPNEAHYGIAALEDFHDVTIITQNVDDLHERAGSSRVLHLHGELMKCRCEKNDKEILDMPESGLRMGDTCPDGHQLRPHVVWFGELVPELVGAERIVSQADMLLVIGTSLNVYPAAGLVHAAPPDCEIILIDPAPVPFYSEGRFRHIQKTATAGVNEVLKKLIP